MELGLRFFVNTLQHYLLTEQKLIKNCLDVPPTKVRVPQQAKVFPSTEVVYTTPDFDLGPVTQRALPNS